MAFSCTRRKRILSGASRALVVFFIFVFASAMPARADIVYLWSHYLSSLSKQFTDSTKTRTEEFNRRRNELMEKYRSLGRSVRTAQNAADRKAIQAERRGLRRAIQALPMPPGAKEREKWVQNKIKQDLRQLKADNPGLSEQDAMAKLVFRGPAAKQLAKFREALAPAPMFKDKTGVYFQGTVVEYLRGLHMDPKDPASSDQIVFRAYGRNGGQKSRKTARISTRYIKAVFHDYDTRKDFAWRFSNRHELLKEPFGSKRHRQSIFALFDSDGEMGLSDGGRFRFGRELKEGLITRFMVEGLPPINEQLKKLLWNKDAPFSFSNPVQDIVRQGGYKVAGLTPFRLFLAMARARVYNIADPGIAKLARHGASILCTMALADPGSVSGVERGIAERARRLGLGCYESVLHVLSESYETYQQPGFMFGVLPVEPGVMQQAVLEFVLSEDVFRTYLGSQYHNWHGKFRPKPAVGGPTESYGITATLAEIGMGLRARHAGTDRQKLAIAALERMITTAPARSPEDREYNELQSRTHRDALLSWASSISSLRRYGARRPPRGPGSPFPGGRNRPNIPGIPGAPFPTGPGMNNPRSGAEQQRHQREDWVYAMFCRVGWGHSDDIVPKAEGALFQARNLLWKDVEGKLEPSQRPELKWNFRLIAWMLKTARPGDHQEKILLDEINKELDRMRQLARKAQYDTEKTFYRRYFDTLEALQAAGGRCI